MQQYVKAAAIAAETAGFSGGDGVGVAAWQHGGGDGSSNRGGDGSSLRQWLRVVFDDGAGGGADFISAFCFCALCLLLCDLHPMLMALLWFFNSQK
jgi:hypothetical protein